MFKKTSFFQFNVLFLSVVATLFLFIQMPLSTWAMASFQQYTQAVGLYRSGQYTQAYQQFSGLMQAHPDDVRLPYYMALTAVRLGKVDQAKRYYETILTIAPKSLVAPYAKQGLALLQEAQKLDAPPSPSSVSAKPVAVSTIQPVASVSRASQHNTLVAQWQKTHPVKAAIPTTTASSTLEAKPEINAVQNAQLPVSSEPSGVISTVPSTMPVASSKEIGISPAMLAVSATGSAGVAPVAQPPTATTMPPVAQTAEQLQLQQQQQNQQLMQTMMMMQMMGGSGGGANGGNSNGANPMAMMLPMMMMQQQQQTPTAGGGVPANPFSGIDPKMMSDMMTQGMMNNLDLFSDSKREN